MTIGERLKAERERLGFTQPVLAAIAETTKKSQIDYEKDLTQPKAGYLAAIAKVGADIQYIVTGASGSACLPAEESELLDLYRAAPLAVKMAAVGALQGGLKMKLGKDAPRQPSRDGGRPSQIIHGNVAGDVAGGDITKN